MSKGKYREWEKLDKRWSSAGKEMNEQKNHCPCHWTNIEKHRVLKKNRKKNFFSQDSYTWAWATTWLICCLTENMNVCMTDCMKCTDAGTSKSLSLWVQCIQIISNETEKKGQRRRDKQFWRRSNLTSLISGPHREFTLEFHFISDCKLDFNSINTFVDHLLTLEEKETERVSSSIVCNVNCGTSLTLVISESLFSVTWRIKSLDIKERKIERKRECICTRGEKGNEMRESKLLSKTAYSASIIILLHRERESFLPVYDSCNVFIPPASLDWDVGCTCQNAKKREPGMFCPAASFSTIIWFWMWDEKVEEHSLFTLRVRQPF